MAIQEKNYWLETVSIPRGKTQALPETVDVAVIGGGFTGLSAALALAKRGVSVCVLEAENFGWGASSRNGGMALTGLKLPVSTLIARYGLEKVRRMYAASLEAIDCVERIVHEEKINCDFARCGHLEVACKPAHFAGYAKSAALIAREFNHQLRIVPKGELPNEIGSHIYYGGMVDETSAGLNPARYVAGLAAAAQRAGAILFDHTRVRQVEAESEKGRRHFRLRTVSGWVCAREVVLASGAYTTEATPKLRKKVIPIGSYIIATEVLSPDLAGELNPKKRMIYDSKHFLHYYRLTPDNRMLFGGRAAFFPENENTVRRSAKILRRAMIGVYPQLCDVSLEYAWGGTLDFALDVIPHAGCIDGMYYAIGYAGHGVAFATYLGSKIAALICGDATDIPFDGIPFRNAPLGLRAGQTWALALAGAYYKFLDWVS